MKRAAILLCLLGLIGSMLPMTTASAHHRPNSYCSPSGDVCLSTKTNANGVRKLRISLAAKYFGHYSLCVKAPDGTHECHRYKIHDTGPGYGDSVNWGYQFPFKGPGPYTVTWKNSGQRIGKRLGFHSSAG
jgi:hypothetical protein